MEGCSNLLLKLVKKSKNIEYTKAKSIPLLLLAVLLTALVLSLFPVKNVFALDDYPSKWRDIPMDTVFDSWGMYNRECVSFVAWRLHSRNKFEMPFHANASDWGSRAKSLGYTVDAKPAVGSVMWMANHVSWVKLVNSNGTVTVEEYNALDSNKNGIYADDGTYSERTLSTGSAKGYIHFKDISNANGGGVSGLTFLGKSYLDTDQRLSSGQYLLSDNVRQVLVMQGDGNLVLYGDGFVPLWASGTAGSGASYAVMQGDGNLVLYTSLGKAIWASNTTGQGSSKLYVQDDGNLVIYSNGVAAWHTRTGGRPSYTYVGSDRLSTYQSLDLNQYIRSSDKRYALLLQGDGNLVLYGPGYRVLWHAGSGSRNVDFIVMQGDGNLVSYTNSFAPVWWTGTGGRANVNAIMQSDGNFVLYAPGGIPVWHTQTAGRI